MGKKEVASMANTDQKSAALIENNHQSKDYLGIDIPEEDLEPAPECCIYKVPRRFRVANEKAFTPQLISIGPLHHGNDDLAQMERQKLRYCKKFCERTSKETLEQFFSFIKEHVKRICRCYDVEFVLETESEASKFMKMILYDAVFIIEFFLRIFENEVSDFLLHISWLRSDLLRDLMLLENQLPFFVLEDLYNLAFATSDKPPLRYLACFYFRINEEQTFGVDDKKGIKHITDLLRSQAVRSCPSNSVERVDNIYSATMLHEAGVKFRAIEGDCLLNVKFEKGELQIPTIEVGDTSVTYFRNLIAFEQCHYPEEAYFCSYIQLLDYLVDIDKDVDLLVKEGIFVNGMGSTAALADSINNLTVGVAQLTLCYDKIGKDLNQYYDNSWNRTRATLKHVYFNNLWEGTTTVAAFIMVILVLIQTILAILDRAMPTK